VADHIAGRAGCTLAADALPGDPGRFQNKPEEIGPTY
jgi:hypothetical protein